MNHIAAIKPFHRGIMPAILSLVLFANLSCSGAGKDDRAITDLLDKNGPRLLEFQIPSQEVSVHENFQKYKAIKLELLKKYFLHQDYRNELTESEKIKNSLDANRVDMYLANIAVFNNEIIEVIRKEPVNKNILKPNDIDFIKKN